MKQQTIVLLLTLSGVIHANFSLGGLPLGNRHVLLTTDTTPLVYQSIILQYNNQWVEAERIGLQSADSLRPLSEDGVHRSKHAKYLLETKNSELLKINLKNSSKVIINSESSVSFNPDVPNFFYLKDGEMTLFLKQHSIIYLNDSVYLWGLAGATINIKNQKQLAYTYPAVTLLEGQGEVVVGKVTQKMAPVREYDCRWLPLNSYGVDSADVITWNKANFNYSDIPFYLLLERLTRWYNLDISYHGTIPEQVISFKGKFSEPLTEIIERLNKKRKKVHCSIIDNTLNVEVK